MLCGGERGILHREAMPEVCVEDYITVKEVAVKMRLSEQTVYRLVSKKAIPFHKIQRCVRFRPSEIEWWIANRAKGELFASLPDGEGVEEKE
jgi:excisionase family DNA binding protein